MMSKARHFLLLLFTVAVLQSLLQSVKNTKGCGNRRPEALAEVRELNAIELSSPPPSLFAPDDLEAIKHVYEQHIERWSIDNQQDRCAILFFGLPRAFKDVVLPSIKKHILIPNAGCDIFVHYHRLYNEAQGRFNPGGVVPADDVNLIFRDVWDIHREIQSIAGNSTLREPVVIFDHDTTESFQAAQAQLLNKTKNTTTHANGQPVYTPHEFYQQPDIVENIFKQWHSVESVWNLMEQHAARTGSNYTRIGAFRSDVMFLNPIDVMLKDANNTIDTNNTFAVVPAWGCWFNDRMMYGPHAAMRIWATERFKRLDAHVYNKTTIKTRMGAHPETFLSQVIQPAILEAGIPIIKTPNICFLRTRPGNLIKDKDCENYMPPEGALKRIETILGRKCRYVYRSIFIECRTTNKTVS